MLGFVKEMNENLVYLLGQSIVKIEYKMLVIEFLVNIIHIDEMKKMSTEDVLIVTDLINNNINNTLQCF